jgi:diguanylate cyclase
MKKILVIEDTAPIRRQIQVILKMRGYDTASAEDGQEGVRLAREWRPDLVVCDVMLPGLDGFEVLAALRSDPQTAAVPFIFLSAKASKADMRHGMELGADDYLTKPFTTDELLSAVRSRLDRLSALAAQAAPAEAAADLDRDSLTGLPTAAALYRCLSELILSGRGGPMVALIDLDLDRFRHVTAALGPASGDALVRVIALRLEEAAQGPTQIFRTAEDEFAVLVPGLRNRSDAAEEARRLMHAVRLPIAFQGHDLHLTASAGIAIHPDDGHELVARAEAALDAAKSRGRNNYQFYRRPMVKMGLDAVSLHAELDRVLDRGELLLHFQPQVDLNTRRIVGAASLLRWRHPEHGLLSADRFLHVAEQAGRMPGIGAWILQTACAQGHQWQEAGLRPVRMTVNLSIAELRDPSLCETVARRLLETGLEPTYLELEIPESAIIADADSTIALLLELKGMGVQIGLDNFGTGYSSLGYLKRFQIDSIKIDPTYLRDVPTDRDAASRVIEATAMAHSLGIEVIADGVETYEQLLFLRTERIDGMQGHYFSKPVPPGVFAQMVLEDKRLE